MYRENVNQMLMPHEFFLPFGGTLKPDNRWCRIALMLPWPEIEKKYVCKLLGLGRGKKAYSVRMALGSLLIAQRMGLTDRETVEMITENPYRQYLLGLPGYRCEAPFDPSLMVYFRRRLGDVLQEISEQIAVDEIKRRREEEARKKAKDAQGKGPPDAPGSGGGKEGSELEQLTIENMGSLILDATCVPADIYYPTDFRLVNDAREALEAIIDAMHHASLGKKPHTYRNKARRDYLHIAKRRKVSSKQLRKGIGKQLRYILRDLKIIESLAADGNALLRLTARQYRNLLVAQELYRQQNEMYRNGTHQIPDRIVSLHMPHIRPIVRGKAGSETEFGVKLAASVIDGFVFIDKLSFDAFNESTLLISCVEKYKKRFGCYPQAVMADQIYRTRDNLNYCKKNHIRLSGKPLGRPPKDEARRAERIRLERQDARYRVRIEGKFGVGKRAYGLSRILSRLPITSHAVIGAAVLAMNLDQLLKFLFALLRWRSF